MFEDYLREAIKQAISNTKDYLKELQETIYDNNNR